VGNLSDDLNAQPTEIRGGAPATPSAWG